jgi:threonine synthase
MYINPRTGNTWPIETPVWRAPDDLGTVALVPGPAFTRDLIERGQRGIWRYAAAIRGCCAHRAKSLGEGGTPLIAVRWNAQTVHAKLDYLNPSGSFKDRGAAVLLNYLSGHGVRSVVEDSSGNAGAACATYAAALGMQCKIFIPDSAPAAKRLQILAMGAEICEVQGTREDASIAAQCLGGEAFYASNNHQPFFLEGAKTIGYEIWEQLGFSIPDVLITPLGQGANVLGTHYAWAELRKSGEIARLPRLYAVQARNAGPYLAAWELGSFPALTEILPTIADGIAARTAIRLVEVSAAIAHSEGEIVGVTETEIASALRQALAGGLYIEPTSATALAGLTKLQRSGQVRPGERAVVILTGSGLKAATVIGDIVQAVDWNVQRP